MPWKDSITKKYSAIKARVTEIAHAVTDVYHSHVKPIVITFVVDTVVQGFDFLVFLYNSPVIRKKLKDTATEGWQGFRSTLRWDLLYNALTKSEELRKFVGNSLFANIVLYAGPVIVYEGYLKPGLRGLFPDLEDSNSEKTYHYPVMFCFGALFLGTLVKNISYSACITYQTSIIAPKENFSACPHGTLEHVKADARSLVYYPRNLLTAYFASSFGSIAFQMVAALAYGQVIVEAKDSLVGVCTEDRAKQFRRNNAYNFMVGVSFMMMTELLNQFFSTLAWWGTGSFFLRDAAMSCVLPMYIMLSLLREELLPGKEDGFDFFEFNRYEMTTRLTRIFNWAVPALMDEQTRAELKGYVSKVAHFPPVKLIGVALAGYVGLGLFPMKKLYENPKIIFSGKLFTPETLLQIPEFHALVEMHAAAIKKGVNIIKLARSASWVGAFIPGFLVSPHITGGLTMLANLDKGLLKTIESLPKIAEGISWEKKEGEVLETYVNVPARGDYDWNKSAKKLERSQSADAKLRIHAVSNALTTKVSDDWEWVEQPVVPQKPKPIRRIASSPAIHRFGLFACSDDSFVVVDKAKIKQSRPMLVSRPQVAPY